MPSIVTIGEILIDLTQTGCNEKGIPQFSANPGGAPANAAVAAARLGASTAFIGQVGNDSFGQQLMKTLQENHVDFSGVSTTNDAPTTLAIATVDETGERSFSFYRSPGADLCLKREDIPNELLGNTKLLHFGSLSFTAEPARSAVLEAIRWGKEQGAWITYDPNYREALWADIEEAKKWMRMPLSMVDILKISDEEVELLSGETDLSAAGKALQKQGFSLVLITLGAKGVYYRFGEQEGIVSGFSVTVADTNGAGDTFFGAVLSRLAQREKPLEGLTIEELEKILRFANKAASLTTSRHGAIPAMPTLEEVEKSL